MKAIYITLIAFVFLLTGCGASEVLTRGCGGDLDQLCDMMFGKSAEKSEENEDNIEENKDDIEKLKQLIKEVKLLKSNIRLLESQIQSLETDTQKLEEEQDKLQSSVNEILAEIAALKNNDSVVEYIDPCGDGSGFDEILLRMSSGKLVAYFENFSNDRFLTIIDPGAYVTTDRQRCRFNVNDDNEVIELD